jgi:uncharacterized ion transporter superfamily protein YfcC
MFLLFLPLSFLIPSSSGLATVAMPIMAPLAGFAASTAARRHRLPERLGLMNLFIPTSAVVMGGLAIARVPYGTYLAGSGRCSRGRCCRALTVVRPRVGGALLAELEPW